jgi:Acetokinase family
MDRAIVVLNSGSSSLKSSVFLDRAWELQLLFRGQAEGLFTTPRFRVRDQAGVTVAETEWPEGTRLGHEGAIEHLIRWAAEVKASLGGQRLDAVGHRVVHGGLKYREPTRINAKVLADLEELAPLAPLHQPHNLALIRTLAALRPDLPQVACFDTAFHRTRSEVAQAYALPHCRDRRARGRDPGPGLLRRRLARRRAGRGGQRGRRPAHQAGGQQGLRVGHPDGRGIDDRPSYQPPDGRMTGSGREHEVGLIQASVKPPTPHS